MRIRHFLFPFAAVALVLGACSQDGAQSPAGEGPITITASVDPGDPSFSLTRQMADEFEKQSGVKVQLLKGPADATERLSQYLQYLGAKSPDIDVYQIDVIWPAILAEHLADLKESFASEIGDFFPTVVQNNTVDGKLVAIPWFGDAGLLYYRPDLLEKYAYAEPPKTWEELEAMATKIQEGERAAGIPDFWGYVWQGKAYEGLTCNALEWQVSSGGGTIVDDKGQVTVNNLKAAEALGRAAGWVGRISPPGVTTYGEEEARQLFQSGNAAFMRNWPYAYSLAQGAGSRVQGNTGIAQLPSGGAGHAATLGGWQLGVSAHSRYPKEAAEFVRFMTSAPIQKRRARELSLLPTRVPLYEDKELVEALPILPVMKDVFLAAVARPSTQSGDLYNEVSTQYFQAVHGVLTGQTTVPEALARAETQLKEILR